MISKRKRLKSYQLYVILNKPFFKDIPDMVRVAGGIGRCARAVIQLRDKGSDKKDILRSALLLKRKLSGSGSIFIVNDHADIAMISSADGLHLGQSDLPPAAARRLLGPDKIIGVSCRNLEQALKAQEQGADYIGIGPVFPTRTKTDCGRPLGLELLAAVTKKIKIPVFAIGGISEANIKEVLSLGCQGGAVSSAICCARDPVSAARRFSKLLDH